MIGHVLNERMYVVTVKTIVRYEYNRYLIMHMYQKMAFEMLKIYINGLDYFILGQVEVCMFSRDFKMLQSRREKDTKEG